MFISLNSLGSMVLDVNGNRLDATFIDQAGVKRDYFTILKRRHVVRQHAVWRHGRHPARNDADRRTSIEGGSGVAYLDTTAGNAGGKYRTTNVDIEGTVDTGGGYNVGWTRPGEWLKYSVTRGRHGHLHARRARRKRRYRRAVPSRDRRRGSHRSDRVPNTGGWQTWQTVTKTGLSLTAGTHAVPLVLDIASVENGGVGNYNWLRVR